jgi:ABC-2 type transport system permease protein
MNAYRWLIRREFWENRAIWAIPLVVGGCLVLAALFGRVDVVGVFSQMPGRAAGLVFLLAAGATFFAIMSIYSTWYLLDCLYADRKDRSVLFWKSLPISDATTVLSKLATALLVIPVVYFAAADLTSLLMAFIISVRARSSLAGAFWHADVWLQLQALWVYLIAASAIWYLPLCAYLLVISAWAKRAVMLWSLLPPIALVLAERWFSGTHVIASQIGLRLWGLPQAAFHSNLTAWLDSAADGAVRTPAPIWSFFDIGGFLSNSQTWAGAAVGIALLFCAIQLRTRRAEI